MNRLLKKDKGNVTHIFPAIITMILVALAAVIFTSWMANNDRKEAIDLIARKYILRMETNGYLSDVDGSELIAELSSRGMTDITLTGTTNSQVTYGDCITLCISGNMTIYNYKVLKNFMLDRGTDAIWVTIRKTSTAKH